jgi:hypothetical protein
VDRYVGRYIHGWIDRWIGTSVDIYMGGQTGG